MKALHELLLKHKIQLAERFSTLPGAYKVQMMNVLEYLCDLDSHDFVIKPRTSFIFTGDEEENLDDENNENIEQNIDQKMETPIIDVNNNTKCQGMCEDDEECLQSNENIEINCPSTRTEELLRSANTQQRFLANFVRQYLVALMAYEQNRRRFKHASKPLPFHIVVNGLAGSGKSYVISIIEQMLTDFCISESAMRNRPRKRKGLLKMAHTGKAALNILGWTIHTALGMVQFLIVSYINN
jgi:hypothetical protein